MRYIKNVTDERITAYVSNHIGHFFIMLIVLVAVVVLIVPNKPALQLAEQQFVQR